MAFAYEVYCYYNVDTLAAVFNGVAMIVNGGGYATLIKSVLTLGVIIMAMVSLGTGRFEGMKWLVVAAILYVGFLGPKTNVMLVDRVSAQPPQVVANVPVGLAFMAHFTSSVGDWMTTTMESAFLVLPNTLKFGSDSATTSPGETRGLLFGARLLDETRRAVIANPKLRQDWYAFVRNCTIYDIAAERIDPDALQKSTDVIGLLGATSVSRMTTQNETGQPVMDSCNLVYPNLVRRLNLDAISETNALGRKLNPNFKTTDPNAAVLSAYNTQSAESTQLMLGVSKNATELISQSMMINLMDSAGAVIGQQLNDPSSVSIALAQAQAEATANSSYATMAKVAESAMPKIRNVIEVVIYATFPIIMLIILVAGHRAGAPLKAYFMTMVWLQLWPPLYAILNLVVTMETAKQTMAAAAAAGGGLTIVSSADIGAVSMSSQAIAGYMVMLIPVIAGAITKGGEQAMTSLASSLTAPSQQAASKAGDQAATGNLSYGNTSLDNHAAHNTNMWKSDTNFSNKSGMMSMQTPGGGSLNANSDGSIFGADAKNDLLVRGGLAKSVKQQHEQAQEQSARLVQTEKASLTDAQGAVLGHSSLFGVDAKHGVQVNDEARKGMTSDAYESFSKTAALANHIKERTGVTNEEAITLAGSVAAGGSMEGAVKAVAAKAGGKASKMLREMADGVGAKGGVEGRISGKHLVAQDIENSSQTQEARESGKRLSHNLASGETAIFTKGGGVSGDDKLTASLDKVKTAQHGYETAVTTEATAKDSMKRAEESANKFEQEILSDPRKFAQLAEANPWVDANNNKHDWTAGEYLSTTHMGKKEAMNQALMRGLGIETPNANLATATNIATPGQLAGRGKELVQSQTAQDSAEVAAQGALNAGAVQGAQNRAGVDPRSATAAATTQAKALHNEANGGLLKAQGAIAQAGLNLGQQQSKFDAAVKEGNTRTAFHAFRDGVAANPQLAATLLAAPLLGDLSRGLDGFLSKGGKDDLPGKGGGVGKAVGKEVAEHAKDLGKLEKLLSAARGVRNASALVAAGSGVGLPAAAAEMAVTEGLFMLADSVISAKKAEATEAAQMPQPGAAAMQAMPTTEHAGNELHLSKPDNQRRL